MLQSDAVNPTRHGHPTCLWWRGGSLLHGGTSFLVNVGGSRLSSLVPPSIWASSYDQFLPFPPSPPGSGRRSEERNRRRRRGRELRGRGRERSGLRGGEDVGVLPDIAAPYVGDGDGDSAVLRRAGCSQIRALLRRIRVVLLPLYHHPRPRGHLDGVISRLPLYPFPPTCMARPLLSFFLCLDELYANSAFPPREHMIRSHLDCCFLVLSPILSVRFFFLVVI